MAKRKRLSPADPDAPIQYLSSRPDAMTGPERTRAGAPIAEVAGESAARAALDAIAAELGDARASGRLIQSVPVIRIADDHLVRDRMVIDEEEMRALVESLRARGQQTPIEVVALKSGRFGLISGWRRVAALKRLHEETGEERFTHVNALVREPESAADAYLGMVEENEIRAGLSFYERARLASEAARIGVFPDVTAAIAGLYARASASKRSKIASFVTLHDRLGEQLRFGAAIPEKLGLALAGALQSDVTLTGRLRDALRNRDPQDAAEERDTLERALRKAPAPKAPRGEELAPGIFLQSGRDRVTLAGPGLDDATRAALRDWLAARA